MRTITHPGLRTALENAVGPILSYLVHEHGAEMFREGLLHLAHQAHRAEVRQQDARGKRERREKRLGRRQEGLVFAPAMMPQPVAALTDAEVYGIRRRHRLVEEKGLVDDVETARADRGALLRENDRMRVELLRVQEELEALRSQLAVLDESDLERDLAMLGVRPSCDACGDEIRGEVHVRTAASRWTEDEDDEHERAVELCAACAERRPRLASGVRKVEPLPLRKVG